MRYLSPFVIVLILTSTVCGQTLMESRQWENIRINDDSTTEVQNEQQIVINPKDSTNLVAVWRDFRLGYRQVAYGYSFDGGTTWDQDLFVEPQYNWDSDPGLTVDTAGNFYAVILSYNSTSQSNGLFVFKSTNGGMSWGTPATVINNVPGVFEDKELIACDRSGGPYTDNLYVAWARFYTTEILLCRSTDGGNSFVGPVSVSDANGVQWPVPCVGTNSDLYVAWVHYTPGSIRLDKSTDGGQTFGTDITVQNTSYVYGLINGGIAVFSFPAMDADITGGPYNGNLYIAYMDYSPGNTDTDIYFTRSADGGTTWSSKVRINDDTVNNGCDQFHPWLTVAPDGSIIVVFLDRRLDPGNLYMDLYMTTSVDGGNTWSTNERITTVSSDPTAGSKPLSMTTPSKENTKRNHEPVILAARAGLLGEYIGVTASSLDNIHPVWVDTRLGNQDTYAGYRIPQGIEERDPKGMGNKNIILYPEPFTHTLTVDLSFFSKEREITLELFDIRGKKIFSDIVCPKGHEVLYELKGDTLPTGTYFIRIRSANSTKNYKIHKLRTRHLHRKGK
jgi:hypothetical protein